MTNRNPTCSEQCSEQCHKQMLGAMHVRTDVRTNGEVTHLGLASTPLATRAGAYENRDSGSTTGRQI